MWAQLITTTIPGLMFGLAMLQQFIPDPLLNYVQKYIDKLLLLFDPYVRITFHEHRGQYLQSNKAYPPIREYLGANSTKNSNRLQAHLLPKGKQPLVLTMDDHEEVVDEFEGVTVWWRSVKTVSKAQTISFYPSSDEKRCYTLKFHKSHREIITKLYIDHVIREGKAIRLRNKVRKLYTNNPCDQWYDSGKWSHVTFDHPTSFDTLAMEAKKKEEIKSDLVKFSNGKEYYAKIGKSWKRGYLLYGPPGTGKSSMIAAMANFLCYDVYDLELTTVRDNTELRKLLIETTSKSIIVIEDIDCSTQLTGKRKGGDEKNDDEEKKTSSKNIIWRKMKGEEEEGGNDKKSSKLTLSGLLNFIDGIWSACGGERIIVFTTNHVEKLDPALIRRGRMDKHIEMSYCCFEAFKMLAKNYLEVEPHELFGRIEKLLGEIEMSPADVAENLMPKSEEEGADSCLANLISALERAKMKHEKKLEVKGKEQRKKKWRWLVQGWKQKEVNSKSTFSQTS